jgi:hypothetical protein
MGHSLIFCVNISDFNGQTYHRIKEWEVNLFICYRKISQQKHVGYMYMWGYDAIEIKFKSKFIIMHNV